MAAAHSSTAPPRASTSGAVSAARAQREADKQWLFTPAMLDHTPSRADSIPLARELAGRRETIHFMRSLWLRVAAIKGDHLGDAESTDGKGPMTVGATLVHRFFMRRSLRDFEPKLVAPVMLFLASKVEEAPLRLRHIVNACLAKFEPGAPLWDPERDAEMQPLEYRRWEKDILATEEVALETLCFDMVVEQPWPILWRGVRGLDGMWAPGGEDRGPEVEAGGSARDGPDAAQPADRSNGQGASTGAIPGRSAPRGPDPKGKSRATEEVVTELGWAMLNEAVVTPLPVLYTAPVLALAAFALILAVLDRVPLSEALAAAAELGPRFRLEETTFDLAEGAAGTDMGLVKDALQQFVEYCDMGIIDKGLCAYIEPEPESSSSEPRTYRRRFVLAPAATASEAAAGANGGWVNGVNAAE